MLERFFGVFLPSINIPCSISVISFLRCSSFFMSSMTLMASGRSNLQGLPLPSLKVRKSQNIFSSPSIAGKKLGNNFPTFSPSISLKYIFRAFLKRLDAFIFFDSATFQRLGKNISVFQRNLKTRNKKIRDFLTFRKSTIIFETFWTSPNLSIFFYFLFFFHTNANKTSMKPF